MSTIVDTPAYKAGLLAGDKIVKIDGQVVAELERPTLDIRGKVGEPVRLTIQRQGASEPVELPPIERAIIQVPSVIGDTRQPDGSWNYYSPGIRRSPTCGSQISESTPPKGSSA